MGETNRRDFLRILGIGTTAGLAGCSMAPPDQLEPYVIPPEEMVRGHALWFASTCRECPAGCGLHARVREGRVRKVEGNPVHPVNAGGLCARGQASVQGLYNPDRLRSPLVRNPQGALQPATWQDAEKRLVAGLSQMKGRPEAIGIVTGSVTGSMAELVRTLLESLGGGRHLIFEPIAYENLREANRLSFGAAAVPVLRFAEAQTIFVFGADVIETFVSPVGYARGIADARRAGGRMVYFGPRLSLTGARADEWVQVAPGADGRVAMALVREILAQSGGSHLSPDERVRLTRWSEPFTADAAGISQEALQTLAREFRAKPSLAVTGGTATCDEHALSTALSVNFLNLAAGNVNRTVRFDRSSSLDRAATRGEVTQWQQSMESGALQALLIVDANPAYGAPGFVQALEKVPFVACLSSCQDETVEMSHVAIPVHTPLESWGDYEPWAGIHSLQQETMRPVFDTRDQGDVLIGLAKTFRGDRITEPNFREFVRNRWRRLHVQSGSKEDFDTFWASALQRGGYWADAPSRSVRLSGDAAGEKISSLLSAPAKPEGYRLLTYPSLAHFDGRSANRPWLQELPDPITQVVWDSWVEVNPEDAARLNIQTGDRVRVQSAHGEVELGAYVYPGIAQGTVAIPLGQGHTAYGRYATGVGVKATALLDPAADPATGGTRWSGIPVGIRVVRRSKDLVVIAGHDLQEHREIARSRTVTPDGPAVTASEEHPQMSLYPPHEHKTHRWGMVIDLDACNGCSACVTACYAENNIPVVGRTEVGRGREMSWIRVERFFGRESEISQPFEIDLVMMLCQQCDKAPCEPVCPVFAAYHTEEGLNGQVYNRCVGTRYCSNNCPYKVRRFNWYPSEWPAPLDWQLNPDVTVRSKGVMEKCTFCVQRITEGKDRARREGRTLADGDIVPACAQSCPAQAIVFGDLKDKESRVSRLAENERRYRVLEELNTRPAVTYLERERRKV